MISLVLLVFSSFLWFPWFSLVFFSRPRFPLISLLVFHSFLWFSIVFRGSSGFSLVFLGLRWWFSAVLMVFRGLLGYLTNRCHAFPYVRVTLSVCSKLSTQSVAWQKTTCGVLHTMCSVASCRRDPMTIPWVIELARAWLLLWAIERGVVMDRQTERELTNNNQQKMATTMNKLCLSNAGFYDAWNGKWHLANNTWHFAFPQKCDFFDSSYNFHDL